MKLKHSTLLLTVILLAGLVIPSACSTSAAIPSPAPSPGPSVSETDRAQQPAPSPTEDRTPNPAPDSPPVPGVNSGEEPVSPADTTDPAPEPTQPQEVLSAPAAPDAVSPAQATDCDAYADFTADLEDPSLGYVQLDHPDLVVELIDRSAGNITKWEWDFDGDGVMEIVRSQRPPAPLKWGYPSKNRTYSVTLRVTDSQGCTHTLTKESYIRVTGCPV